MNSQLKQVDFAFYGEMLKRISGLYWTLGKITLVPWYIGPNFTKNWFNIYLIFKLHKLTLHVKVSLDRTHQDLKLCFWSSLENYPLKMTCRTLEPIFQNSHKISWVFNGIYTSIFKILQYFTLEETLWGTYGAQNQLYTTEPILNLKVSLNRPC